MNADIASKDIAKRRLKNVLDAERNGLTQSDLEMVKKDLVAVLESYFTTEGDKVAIKIDRRKGREDHLERILTLSAKVGGVKRTGFKT